MKQEDLNQLDDNLIMQKLQEAFGYSDEQLAEELDRAAADIAASTVTGTVAGASVGDGVDIAAGTADKRLQAPSGEFEKIMARVNADKAVEANGETSHKVLRLKRILRPMLIAAALVGVLLATGIGVSGKRDFEYRVRDRGDSAVVFNNVENLESGKKVDEAYKQIEEELGIDALEMFYMPKGMTFENIEIKNGRARIDFIYEDNYVYFYQILRNMESSVDYTSDRLLYETVHNRYLEEDIFIYKNELENDCIEFSMQLVNEKAHYYLAGIFDEDEFLKLVENLKFYSR